VHIFRHLFVWFQTSVYTLGEFHKNRNKSTVFEELSVSIVDLTPPTLQIQYCYSLIIPLSACFFGIPTSYVFRSLKHDQNHIAECQRKYSIIFLSIALRYRWRYFSQIVAWKCNLTQIYMGQDITTFIPILMKFSQRVHTSLKSDK
jgi:hypothetical protein